MPEPRGVGTGNKETPAPFLYGYPASLTIIAIAIGVAATSISAMTTPTEYLYINTRDELLRIDCTKIVYMEGDGNYTNIVLINKIRASVCMNLSEMQKLISNSLRERSRYFVRIGKRFIVNVNFIHHINVLRQSLTVTDGVHFTFQLGISKEALKQMKALMLEHAKNNQPNQE